MARSVSFDVLAVAKGVGFDELGMKIQGIARDTQTHVSGLVAAAAAFGPALIPIGAAVTAVGAGLAGLGSVGILAFAGIRNEMKQGTVLGLAYQQAFKPIVDEFHALSYLSAVQVFAGINTAVASSRRLFPLVAQDVSLLAGQLGQIVAHIAPGLVALFVRLNPLLVGVGAQLVKLSAGFERWATSGTGVTKFVAYAQANLPRVEKTLGQIAVAVGHLLQGLVPLGGVSFSTIGAFAKLVNAIPVPILKDLAPIVAGIIVATKTWEVAQKALNLVMDANPFVAVAALILAVGTALVEAYKHSQTFRDVVQTVFHYVKTAALDLGISFIKFLLIPILDSFSAIVHGAAAAFGWIPGLGPKLRAARAAFDQFRRDADRALHGMEATLSTENARNALHGLLAELRANQHVTIYTDLYTRHINEFINKPATGTYTQNAKGGTLAEGWNMVGEEGWEWAYKSGSKVQVFPHGTGGPTAAPAMASPRAAGSTVVNVYVTNPDARAVIRELEQWVGRGGKAHIGRGIVS